MLKFKSTEKLYSILFVCFSAYLVALSFSPDGISYSVREDGPIENFTAIFAFLGAYLCVQIFILRDRILSQRSYLLLLGAALFFFMCGEEISWGQRLFQLKPIISAGDTNYQREMTLHNFYGFDLWVYLGGFLSVLVAAGLFPLLSYSSKKMMALYKRMGIPIMPVSVLVALWLGFIFMVLTRHYVYNEAGQFEFFWDVSYELQEWREFYFSLLLAAYVFGDYFYLLKYNAPYEFRDFSQKQVLAKKFWQKMFDDTALLINHNKPLIIFGLLAVFVAAPLAEEVRKFRIDRDHQLLYGDAQIKIIEGESLKGASPAKRHWVSPKTGTFNDGYLSLHAEALGYGEYYSLKYPVAVAEEGRYKIFVAGSPPGPLASEDGKDYSPYKVVIDDLMVVEVSGEGKDATLEKIFRHTFYSDYVYAEGMTFTKIGEFGLSAGDHTVEFRVSKPKPGSTKCEFALDAIFIVPENRDSQYQFLTLPDDLFSY